MFQFLIEFLAVIEQNILILHFKKEMCSLNVDTTSDGYSIGLTAYRRGSSF